MSAPTLGLTADQLRESFDPHRQKMPSREIDRQELKLYDGAGSLLGSGILAMIRQAQQETLLRPYVQSSIVYACVQAIVRAVADVPIRYWASDEDDAAELPRTHPLVQLFRKPNPLMSGAKLWRAITAYHNLAGGTHLMLFRNRSGRMQPIEPREAPDEIWPVREDLMTPVLDEKTKLPKAWKFVAGTRTIEWPDHAVAHIYDPDPHDPLRGVGPLQAAFRRVNVSFRAEGFDDALVTNGGQIGGVFTHEDKTIKQEKLDVLTQSIAQNAEKPSKSRKNVVLPSGMKFTPTSMSPRDMEAGNLRLMTRDEIMAAFGVPKPLLGYTDDVNRANSREVRRVFYENTIAPFLGFVEEEISAQLMSKLPREWEQLWVEFDVARAPAMREDEDAKLGRMKQHMELGRSYREAAEIVGAAIDLDGLEEIDRHYVPSVWAEVGAAEPEPAPEPPPSKDYASRRALARAFDEMLQPHDARIERAVNGVFGRYIAAQRDKLREVADQTSGIAAAITPWDWFTASSGWPESKRAWAVALDLVPERTWVRNIKGATDEEIERLLLANDEEWGRRLWSAVSGPIGRTIISAAAAVLADTGSEAGIIDLQHPAVLRFMASKEVLLVEGPMSVVAERVRRVIVEGMAKSEGLGTLSERVQSVLEELESELKQLQIKLGTRATLIARTESASAANFGRKEQFVAAGIVQHAWVDSGDEIVRPEHRIDGEVAVVGQLFSNGLEYPGDSRLGPALSANCRCTTEPIEP